MILSEPAPSQGDVHFRLLGFPVRITPFFWVVALIFGIQGKSPPAKVLLWVVAVLVSILIHELGQLRKRLADLEASETQIARVEADLQESEEKLRRVIGEAHDGIAIVDEQGIVIEWNRAMQEITGLEKQQVVGERI